MSTLFLANKKRHKQVIAGAVLSTNLRPILRCDTYLVYYYLIKKSMLLLINYPPGDMYMVHMPLFVTFITL